MLAVYEEASDLNSGSGAVAHFYAADPLGNHHFYVNYQNETGYGGRGLYQAYANSTYLGGSWQILPAQTQFYAQIEADNFSGSNETCPNIHDGQLGMNGVDPPNWALRTCGGAGRDTPGVWLPGVRGRGPQDQERPSNLLREDLDDARPYGLLCPYVR